MGRRTRGGSSSTARGFFGDSEDWRTRVDEVGYQRKKGKEEVDGKEGKKKEKKKKKKKKKKEKKGLVVFVVSAFEVIYPREERKKCTEGAQVRRV